MTLLLQEDVINTQLLYLAMLPDGVNEKTFLSTTMMDFDLLRIKWARLYQPPAGLSINSRKSLSLSMRSNLSRLVNLNEFQPHRSTSPIGCSCSSPLDSLENYVTDIEHLACLLFLLTGCAVLYCALEGTPANLYLVYLTCTTAPVLPSRVGRDLSCLLFFVS